MMMMMMMHNLSVQLVASPGTSPATLVVKNPSEKSFFIFSIFFQS